MREDERAACLLWRSNALRRVLSLYAPPTDHSGIDPSAQPACVYDKPIQGLLFRKIVTAFFPGRIGSIGDFPFLSLLGLHRSAPPSSVPALALRLSVAR